MHYRKSEVLAVGSRTHTGGTFETGIEVGKIVEAAFKTDIGDRAVGFGQ